MHLVIITILHFLGVLFSLVCIVTMLKRRSYGLSILYSGVAFLVTYSFMADIHIIPFAHYGYIGLPVALVMLTGAIIALPEERKKQRLMATANEPAHENRDH